MSQTTFEDFENVQTIQPHKEYYLNGGDLYFLVEDCRFRVHRYFFERESTFFKDKLAAPALPGESRLGSNESSAIILEDILSSEFAQFLWVFYNPHFSIYDATVEEWTVILDLAHSWGFPEVKKLVIRELEKLEMSDVDRIVMYHNYEVDRELLTPRYAALCAREEPLTLREGLRLGMETALMIARARECARSKPTESGARSPYPATIELVEMHTIVKDLFIVPSAKGSTDQDQDSLTSGGSELSVVLPAEQRQTGEEKARTEMVQQLPTPTPTPPPMEPPTPPIQPPTAKTERRPGFESDEKDAWGENGGGEGAVGRVAVERDSDAEGDVSGGGGGAGDEISMGARGGSTVAGEDDTGSGGDGQVETEGAGGQQSGDEEVAQGAEGEETSRMSHSGDGEGIGGGEAPGAVNDGEFEWLSGDVGSSAGGGMGGDADGTSQGVDGCKVEGNGNENENGGAGGAESGEDDAFPEDGGDDGKDGENQSGGEAQSTENKSDAREGSNDRNVNKPGDGVGTIAEAAQGITEEAVEGKKGEMAKHTEKDVGRGTESTKGETESAGAISEESGDQDEDQTDQTSTQGVDDFVNITGRANDADETDGEASTANTQNGHFTSPISADGNDESTKLNGNGDASGHGETDGEAKTPNGNIMSPILGDGDDEQTKLNGKDDVGVPPEMDEEANIGTVKTPNGNAVSPNTPVDSNGNGDIGHLNGHAEDASHRGGPGVGKHGGHVNVDLDEDDDEDDEFFDSPEEPFPFWSFQDLDT